MIYNHLIIGRHMTAHSFVLFSFYYKNIDHDRLAKLTVLKELMNDVH